MFLSRVFNCLSHKMSRDRLQLTLETLSEKKRVQIMDGVCLNDGTAYCVKSCTHCKSSGSKADYFFTSILNRRLFTGFASAVVFVVAPTSGSEFLKDTVSVHRSKMLIKDEIVQKKNSRSETGPHVSSIQTLLFLLVS